MCNNSPCTCTSVGGFWVAPQSSALIILLFLGESNGTGPGLALFAECFSGVGTFSADRRRRRAIAISLCRVRALILLARVQATLHYTAPFEGGQGVVVVMVDGIWVDRRSLYERVCVWVWTYIRADYMAHHLLRPYCGPISEYRTSLRILANTGGGRAL